MTAHTLSATETRTTARRRPRVRTVASWVLQVAVASQFVLAGVPKLTGAPIMVGLFDAVGAGQWLRYVIGTLEVAGAVGLLIPPLAGLAAACLGALMIGAAVTSVAALGVGPAIPLAVAAAAVLVVVLRRDRFFDFVRVIRRYSGQAETRKA